jgi:hypothetical protein
MALRIPALLLMAATACGHGTPAAPPPPPAHDAQVRDTTAIELPAQPLGLADLGGFQWRKRAGQPAFRTARKAEGREDWAAVAASCKEALVADPTHLEAAWLDAVALAKTGHLDGVLAPLVTAGTGDYGKWALASLEQPGLQAWLATPVGAAWRRRVDEDRAGFLAAINRGLVVGAHGDLYAFDAETSRFLRLTRSYGGVIGALAMRAQHRIAYVTHTKDGKLGVGLVNLVTGRTSHPTKLAGTSIRLAANPKGVAIRSGATWQVLDDDGHLRPLAPAPKPTEWLDVKGRAASMHRAPPDGILGDFDDQGLASAIRIGLTNRTITVPGQIDGSTVAWSPDRGHVAFVAQLDDSCTNPNAVSAAAFVADPSTGHVDELERASGGLAVEWVSDRKVAIAGDHGVELYELGGKPVALDGAEGLIGPRRRPRCAAPETPEEPTDDDVGDEGSDVPASP